MSMQQKVGVCFQGWSLWRNRGMRRSLLQFHISVGSSSESLTDDPVLPIQQRRPRWLDDGNDYHHFVTPEYRFHQVYFEVLDHCCGELNRLFDQ